MQTIEQYRPRVESLTLEGCMVLLRRLGDFDLDDLAFVGVGGVNKMFPLDVKRLLGPSTLVREVKAAVVFKGGPSQAEVYRSTFSTFILDRMLLVMCERGFEYVEMLLSYGEGFGLARVRVRARG